MPSTVGPQPRHHSSSNPANYSGHLQAVHTAVPGRARFRIPVLYRAEVLKRHLESHLPKLDGIHAAHANILTASLLVRFDPALTHSAIAATIEGELAYQPKPSVAQGPNLADILVQLFRSPERKQDVSPSAPATTAASQSGPSGPEEPWHALDREAVLARIEGTERGLSNTTAAERLARLGPNTLPQAAPRSDLSLLLEQFVSPPVLLLGASSIVSVLTGGLLEAVAIVGVMVVNALIGFITERQSERAITSLVVSKPPIITVLRDEAVHKVPSSEVVIGDVLTLAAGSYIAADARLLNAEQLNVDESALTGESMAVEKDAEFIGQEETPLGDRRNMVYMGTLVTGGSGNAIIVGTGLNSEIGRIQSLATAAKPPATPMERQLDELGNQLVWLSSAICGVVFVLGLLRGYGWLEMLRTAISLAVAAVPEGLPMVATTTMALGIRNMQRHHVLVRRLDAVETLGSVQFFCFDKTGTLTLNRMAVVAVHAGMQSLQINGDRFLLAGQAIAPLQMEEIQRLCQMVALCNETKLQGTGEELQLNGSATEKALMELALHAGLDIKALQRRYPRLDMQPRTENRAYMATIHQNGESPERLVAVKGSPEQVLTLCRRYLAGGEPHDFGEDKRALVLRENERMAGEALRVLGVAYAPMPTGQGPFDNLVWLGLVGMADPLRPGMGILIKRFHRAGINTAMITGDQSATAYAIARQLDLAEGRSVEILDSGSLDKIDPALLSGVVQRVQVFARVSPAHKLQIVQALQQAGKVVAMTGDGINDGPALKAADLGVAMGSGGTEVARSLANIVLQDDNLATMEAAVRDGRTIYGNVRKAIRYLLSTNLSEIEVMVAGVGLGLGRPLNPMQLLWINLITDIFPGLALAMEHPEPDIMDRPPRDPKEPVIGGKDLRRLGMESVVISGGALASYGYALLRYGPGAQANTHAFMTLALAQLLHAFSSRSERHTPLDRDLPANPYLDAALGVSLIAQLLTVWVPGLRKVLGTTPLTLTDSLIIGAGVALPLLINEGTKKF